MSNNSNNGKSRTNIVMMWFSFEYLAVAVPVLVMMAVHKFILRDFDIYNYVVDILLLAISLATNVVAETIRVKGNIMELFYWIVMIADIAFLCFLAAIYCSIFSALESLQMDSKIFIIRFSEVFIFLNLVVGIILSFFEDVE